MFELTDTTSSEIATALVRGRRNAGSPAMDMVLTLVVVTDEASHYDAMRAAAEVSSEHPSRVIGLVRRSPRGGTQLDAQVSIGDNSPGESLLLRVSGELVRHAESAVLPLLLPDSPVVVWWPTEAPDVPSADAIGRLAQRRITGAAAASTASRHRAAPVQRSAVSRVGRTPASSASVDTVPLTPNSAAEASVRV